MSDHFDRLKITWLLHRVNSQNGTLPSIWIYEEFADIPLFDLNLQPFPSRISKQHTVSDLALSGHECAWFWRYRWNIFSPICFRRQWWLLSDYSILRHRGWRLFKQFIFTVWRLWADSVAASVPSKGKSVASRDKKGCNRLGIFPIDFSKAFAENPRWCSQDRLRNVPQLRMYPINIFKSEQHDKDPTLIWSGSGRYPPRLEAQSW